jgi:hypothetical protein
MVLTLVRIGVNINETASTLVGVGVNTICPFLNVYNAVSYGL